MESDPASERALLKPLLLLLRRAEALEEDGLPFFPESFLEKSLNFSSIVPGGVSAAERAGLAAAFGGRLGALGRPDLEGAARRLPGGLSPEVGFGSEAVAGVGRPVLRGRLPLLFTVTRPANTMLARTCTARQLSRQERSVG